MSKARLVITAVVVENRPVAEVVADYGVSRSWVYELLARYRAEGEAAFEPRSTATADLPVRHRVRGRRAGPAAAQAAGRAGLDAGADTIAWHLHHHHHISLSRATITGSWSAPAPSPPTRRNDPRPPTSGSKPTSPTSAGSPTSPTTDSPPTAPTSRSSPGSTTTPATPCTSPPTRVTGPIVSRTFRQAADLHGYPGVHADRQRHGLHHPLRRRPRRTQRPRARAAPPRHRPEEQPTRTTPPPAARSRRFQQTLKKWLRAQPPARPRSPNCRPCSSFVEVYNHQRPHRSLPHRATPATAYHRPPQSHPGGDRSTDTHDRVRTRHASTNGHGHPARRRPPTPHRRRPNPRPNPRPAARPRPPRHASSTPPPANSSASSHRPQPATTSHQTPPARNDKQPNLRTVGSAVRDVLRHHRAPPVGFEPTLPPPEGGALSPELRGLSEQNPTERALDRGKCGSAPASVPRPRGCPPTQRGNARRFR